MRASSIQRWAAGMVAAGSAICIGAEASGPASRSLTLPECFELALQHNLQVQIERYLPELARYNLNLAYGAYDPAFEVGLVHDYLDQPERFDPKKATPDMAYRQTGDMLTSGLVGQLPFGTSYSLDLGSDWLDARNPQRQQDYAETAVRAGLTVRQPLLRNFRIDSAAQRILVSRKNLKISELSLRWQVMNTVMGVEVAYYDLIQAAETVKLQEKAIELARTFAREMGQRAQAGTALALDRQQAEMQVEQRQADLAVAQEALGTRQNALKNLLTDDFASWVAVELEPADPLPPGPAPVDLSASWQSAMSDRPDLMQSRLELEKQDIVLRYHRNQIFPSLDLVASLGVAGVRDSFGDAIEDMRSAEHPYYSYGIVFSVPLGNRTARNQYRASQGLRKQSLLRHKELEQNIQVRVDSELRIVRLAWRRVQSARQARQYAEAAWEAEQERVRRGLSITYYVLESQQKLTETRVAEVGAMADYNKALARLSLEDATILTRHRLDLEVK